MSISSDFLSCLKCTDPNSVMECFSTKDNFDKRKTWILFNEVRPVDLYCYLWARFGRPNGIQNFLRGDTSDNLIHWDWTLSSKYGRLIFLGMNFRTEVILLGNFPFTEDDKEEFVCRLKEDFSNFGKKMSEVRSKILEKWTEFVNPYHRIKQAVELLLKEVKNLSLEPSKEAIPSVLDFSDMATFKTRWEEVAGRYSKGFGICFGIRSMLPVMAEAFVNLLLFVLMKEDIKRDVRLRENVIRQPIDIRIKSLHHTCIGFEQSVDYSHPACKKYHSFVNERNDLLHGNVVIEKLRFNEVFFNERVPVFQEYRSMWERSFGVEGRAVGLDRLDLEVKTVYEFITYVLSCLSFEVKNYIDLIMQTRDLGFNEETGRLGILFPGYLVDFGVGRKLSDLESEKT